jgi:hypothetical protein
MRERAFTEILSVGFVSVQGQRKWSPFSGGGALTEDRDASEPSDTLPSIGTMFGKIAATRSKGASVSSAFSEMAAIGAARVDFKALARSASCTVHGL